MISAIPNLSETLRKYLRRQSARSSQKTMQPWEKTFSNCEKLTPLIMATQTTFSTIWESSWTRGYREFQTRKKRRRMEPTLTFFQSTPIDFQIIQISLVIILGKKLQHFIDISQFNSNKLFKPFMWWLINEKKIQKYFSHYEFSKIFLKIIKMELNFDMSLKLSQHIIKLKIHRIIAFTKFQKNSPKGDDDQYQFANICVQNLTLSSQSFISFSIFMTSSRSCQSLSRICALTLVRMSAFHLNQNMVRGMKNSPQQSRPYWICSFVETSSSLMSSFWQNFARLPSNITRTLTFSQSWRRAMLAPASQASCPGPLFLTNSWSSSLLAFMDWKQLSELMYSLPLMTKGEMQKLSAMQNIFLPILAGPPISKYYQIQQEIVYKHRINTFNASFILVKFGSKREASIVASVLHAHIFLLPEGEFVGAGVCPLRRSFFHHHREVFVEEQAVHEPHLHFILVHPPHVLQKILGIYVGGLQLHLGLQACVLLHQCLPCEISVGLHQTSFLIVDPPPVLAIVWNGKVLPVASAQCGNGEYEVGDFEEHIGEPEVCNVVGLGSDEVHGFSEANEGLSHKLPGLPIGNVELQSAWLQVDPPNVELDEVQGIDSLPELDGEHLEDEILQVFRDGWVGRELQVVAVDQADQLGDGALLVWTLPEQHLEEDHAHGPDICPGVVDQSLEYLGSHVDGRAHHRLGHVVLLQQLLAEPKIGQLDHSILEQDVCWLQISMQDVGFVQGRKGQSQLFKYLERFLFGESPSFFDEVSQRPAVAILIDQVVVVGGAEHLYELDDVGVGHFAEDVDLVIGELGQLWRLLELVPVHHLHCVQQLRFLVFRAVDVTVLP